MRFQRWTSAADNAASLRADACKTNSNNGIIAQLSGNEISKYSDQQAFTKILSNLNSAGNSDQLETVQTSDSEWHLDGALKDEGTLVIPVEKTGETFDELPSESLEPEEHLASPDRREDSDVESDLELGKDSPASDYSGMGPSIFEAAVEANSPSGSESTSAAQGSLPLNEAAARIIEEMQARARRSESKRWQFCLPGLLDGTVLVTVERLEDQSWVVELSTPDECSDEERLSLEHRLSARMGDVTLSTASL